MAFGPRFYTLFTTLADGKGLILGFELFGFVYPLFRKTHVTSLVEYSTLLELYGKVCAEGFFSDPFCLQVGKSEDPLLHTGFGTSFQSANLQSVREKDSPKTFAG